MRRLGAFQSVSTNSVLPDQMAAEARCDPGDDRLHLLGPVERDPIQVHGTAGSFTQTEQQLALAWLCMGRDQVVAIVALPEQESVGFGRRPHRVEEDAGPCWGVGGVDQMFAVSGESHARVALRWEAVFQMLSCLHIENAQGEFVLTSVAQAIEDVAPVGGDIEQGEADGMIRAEWARIHKNPFSTRGQTGHVEETEVLVGSTPQIEQPPAPHQRQTDDLHPQQLAQPAAELLAPRNRVEGPPCAGILGCNPCARRRSSSILEPAVGIGDADAMQLLDNIIFWRGRRAGTRCRGLRSEVRTNCQQRAHEQPNSCEALPQLAGTGRRSRRCTGTGPERFRGWIHRSGGGVAVFRAGLKNGRGTTRAGSR